MDAIAQQLARALTRFFGLPFIYPMEPEEGRVQVGFGTLNLRDYPSAQGRVIAALPDGAAVDIHFVIAQAFGARYEAYAADLTKQATAILGLQPMPAEIDVDVFLKEENKVSPAPVAVAPPPAPAPVAAPAPAPVARFCTRCGSPIGAGARFCTRCGNKL